MLSRRLFVAATATVAVTPGSLAATTRAQNKPEATIDRIQRTKVLRIAARPDEAPYFTKDVATGAWAGMGVEMAKDIALIFDAKVEYFESANTVLDLQANKIDLALPLDPTPKRALAINFSHPLYMHGFGIVAKQGFRASNWGEVNKPEVRIAVDTGSVAEILVHRCAPQATIIGLQAREDCIMAVQTGRADCVILAVDLALTTVKKNPALGEFQMLDQPRVQLPACIGVRIEGESRWRGLLDAWADYNRGAQQIREWLYSGLAINDVKPEEVPPDFEF